MSNGHALPSLPHPSLVLKRKSGGAGILTCCPSPSALAYGLGPTKPYADKRCVGNLGLSASGIFTLIYATHSGILTSPRSSKPHDSPSSPEERSPTMPRRCSATPTQLSQACLRFPPPEGGFSHWRTVVGWVFITAPEHPRLRRQT